jgi:hypothetical protein
MALPGALPVDPNAEMLDTPEVSNNALTCGDIEFSVPVASVDEGAASMRDEHLADVIAKEDAHPPPSLLTATADPVSVEISTPDVTIRAPVSLVDTEASFALPSCTREDTEQPVRDDAGSMESLPCKYGESEVAKTREQGIKVNIDRVSTSESTSDITGCVCAAYAPILASIPDEACTTITTEVSATASSLSPTSDVSCLEEAAAATTTTAATVLTDEVGKQMMDSLDTQVSSVSVSSQLCDSPHAEITDTRHKQEIQCQAESLAEEASMADDTDNADDQCDSLRSIPSISFSCSSPISGDMVDQSWTYEESCTEYEDDEDDVTTTFDDCFTDDALSGDRTNCSVTSMSLYSDDSDEQQTNDYSTQECTQSAIISVECATESDCQYSSTGLAHVYSPSATESHDRQCMLGRYSGASHETIHQSPLLDSVESNATKSVSRSIHAALQRCLHSGQRSSTTCAIIDCSDESDPYLLAARTSRESAGSRSRVYGGNTSGRYRLYSIYIDYPHGNFTDHQELLRILRDLADSKNDTDWQDEWYDELPMWLFHVYRKGSDGKWGYISPNREEVREYVKKQYRLVVESRNIQDIDTRAGQSTNTTAAGRQSVRPTRKRFREPHQHLEPKKAPPTASVGEFDINGEFTIRLGWSGAFSNEGTHAYREITAEFYKANSHKEWDEEVYQTLRSLLSKYTFCINMNKKWQCATGEQIRYSLRRRWVRLLYRHDAMNTNRNESKMSDTLGSCSNHVGAENTDVQNRQLQDSEITSHGNEQGDERSDVDESIVQGRRSFRLSRSISSRDEIRRLTRAAPPVNAASVFGDNDILLCVRSTPTVGTRKYRRKMTETVLEHPDRLFDDGIFTMLLQYFSHATFWIKRASKWRHATKDDIRLSMWRQWTRNRNKLNKKRREVSRRGIATQTAEQESIDYSSESDMASFTSASRSSKRQKISRNNDTKQRSLSSQQSRVLRIRDQTIGQYCRSPERPSPRPKISSQQQRQQKSRLESAPRQDDSLDVAMHRAQQQAQESSSYCDLLRHIQSVQGLLDQQMTQPLPKANSLSDLADSQGLEAYRACIRGGMLRLWEEAKSAATVDE